MNAAMSRATMLALALLAFLLPSRAVAQQKIDAGHLAASDVSIRMGGPIARVRVIGWERDSVSITGSLPKGRRLENMFGGDPGAAVRGVKMFVETNELQPTPAGTVELRVPTGARVHLILGSAEVEATGHTGELDIIVLGGTVRVTGSHRILKVDAIDATVIVDGSPAWARLKSAEGAITMRGGSPDAVFSTVSGDISVSDGALERAKFESTTGSVIFAGDLVRNASVDFDTHSGNVDLRLGLKASVEIAAATGTGSIENLLTKRAPTPGRESRGHEIALTLATGDGRITVRTFKGNIRLSRR
jgi:hypothetical protein